jgi:hypothetical protein
MILKLGMWTQANRGRMADIEKKTRFATDRPRDDRYGGMGMRSG